MASVDQVVKFSLFQEEDSTELVETFATILSGFDEWQVTIPTSIIVLIIDFIAELIMWNEEICHKDIEFVSATDVKLPGHASRVAVKPVITKQLLMDNNNEVGIEIILDDMPIAPACNWIGFIDADVVGQVIDSVKNKPLQLYEKHFHGFTIAAGESEEMWQMIDKEWKECVSIGKVDESDIYGFKFKYDQDTNKVDMELYINGKHRLSMTEKFGFGLPEKIMIFAANESKPNRFKIRKLETK